MLSAVAGLPAGYWPVSSWYLWHGEQLWRSLSYWCGWTTYLGYPFSCIPFCGMITLQYSVAELIQPRLRHFNLPSTLHLPSDIVYLPRQKYIHRGSRRSYNIDGSCQIRSFRSSKPRSARRLTRTVDPGVLTNLTRSVGNDSGQNNSSFGLFNIRSLSTKVPLVYDMPSDRKFDFLGLTETWQKAADFFHLYQSVPPGYSYVCKSRVTGRGGGASDTL